MDQGIFVSPIVLSIVGFLIVTLLGIIAYFAGKTYDRITTIGDNVGNLVVVITEIDGRMTGELGVLKEQTNTNTQSIRDFNPLYDRMRAAENDITGIKASHRLAS